MPELHWLGKQEAERVARRSVKERKSSTTKLKYFHDTDTLYIEFRPIPAAET